MKWVGPELRIWLPDVELPFAYQDAEVDKLPPQVAKVVRAFMPERIRLTELDRGIAPVFLGPAHTGKTYGAACLAKAIRNTGENRLNVQWVSVPAVLAETERFAPKLAEARRVWSKVPVLVLDDLFLFPSGTWQMLFLEGLLHERHEHQH